jgi:hypothetical protein
MKFLIWFVTIFVTALITSVIREAGIILGAIPTVIIYGAMLWVARTLCKKYDERKGIKNKPIEQIDVDRHKDSEMLGKAMLTPYCTNHRYQNKDWATIELFLSSTLCGKNGEPLRFKYQTTTTARRAAGNVEVIYIFDSFIENGEKYSDLYVCDECDAETSAPPVGYRFSKDFAIQQQSEVEVPTFSLSAPDELPTTPGDHHIYGSEIALEKSDAPSSCCPSSLDDEPPHPVDCTPVECISEIKFCRKCGKQLIPNSRFCSYCGTEIAKE